MGNELPSLIAIHKIRPSLQHSLTNKTHILLGETENYICFVLQIDRTTVPMNDLQPHTKLRGKHEALQLGKTGASHTQRVPHSLFKGPDKVTQPNICGNIFLLESPIYSKIPTEFTGIHLNQLPV